MRGKMCFRYYLLIKRLPTLPVSAHTVGFDCGALKVLVNVRGKGAAKESLEGVFSGYWRSNKEHPQVQKLALKLTVPVDRRIRRPCFETNRAPAVSRRLLFVG
jgi:hypothetical protein